VIPGPTPLEKYVEFGGSPADACALGYRRAANVLAEHARQHGGEAFLFYPILFLYRHHVELMLKNLILAFDEAEVRSITQAEELNEKERKGLSNGRVEKALPLMPGHPLERARLRRDSRGFGVP
jgi:hypothetical protein